MYIFIYMISKIKLHFPLLKFILLSKYADVCGRFVKDVTMITYVIRHLKNSDLNVCLIYLFQTSTNV